MYATEQQSPEDSNQYTNATEATTFRLGESLELGDNVDCDYNSKPNLPTVTSTKSISSDYNIQHGSGSKVRDLTETPLGGSSQATNDQGLLLEIETLKRRLEGLTNISREKFTESIKLSNKAYKLITFTGRNFGAWKEAVEVLMQKRGVLSELVNDEECIKIINNKEVSDYWLKATERQRLIYSNMYYELFQSIHTNYATLTQNIQSGDVITLWTKIHKIYRPKGMRSLMALFNAYLNFSLPRGGDLTQYLSNLNKKYKRFSEVHHGKLSEDIKIAKLLTSLPGEYQSKVGVILDREENRGERFGTSYIIRNTKRVKHVLYSRTQYATVINQTFVLYRKDKI